MRMGQCLLHCDVQQIGEDESKSWHRPLHFPQASVVSTGCSSVGLEADSANASSRLPLLRWVWLRWWRSCCITGGDGGGAENVYVTFTGPDAPVVCTFCCEAMMMAPTRASVTVAPPAKIVTGKRMPAEAGGIAPAKQWHDQN